MTRATKPAAPTAPCDCPAHHGYECVCGVCKGAWPQRPACQRVVPASGSAGNPDDKCDECTHPRHEHDMDVGVCGHGSCDLCTRFHEPVAAPTFIDIVFDGPPGHESGRFVEVEDEGGKSINAGEWIKRADGFWVLRIPQPAALARGGE